MVKNQSSINEITSEDIKEVIKGLQNFVDYISSYLMDVVVHDKEEKVDKEFIYLALELDKVYEAIYKLKNMYNLN